MTAQLTPSQLELINAMFRASSLQVPATGTDVPANQGILTIDSKDRYTGSGAGIGTIPINNFRINKLNSSMQASQASKISLTSVYFPWFIHNVNARNNKGRIWDSGGIVREFTLPTGYYDLEAFAPALQLALNTTGHGIFTVAIGPAVTGKLLTVSNPAFWSPDVSPVPGQSQSIWNVAGLVDSGQYTVSTLVLSLTMRFRGWYTRYVDIVSSDMTQYQRVNSEGTHEPANDLIYRIHCEPTQEFLTPAEIRTGPPYCRQSYIEVHDMIEQYFDWNPSRSFGEGFDFRLLDEYGQLLQVDDPDTYPDFTLGFKFQTLKSLPV